MPFSNPEGKKEFKQHFIDTFSITPDIKILDVGAGSGSYFHLLHNNFKNIDALEIFAPYVKNFSLESLYSKVHIGDILNFDISTYDYLIMGDIIEHLYFPEALNLLSKLDSAGKKFMVAVPYLYPQGECYDNIHEIHHQPDLTDELFLMRYPMMKTFWKDEMYGYYINY